VPGPLRPRGKAIATALGEKLEGLEFRHPLAAVHPGYDRVAPVYLADYATAEDGTGIVHSSPAYGIEDFNSCRAHGLAVDAILNPVQGNGVYESGLPLFGGEHIWKANPAIVEALRAAGRLLDSATLVHSYPHCWRHKTPVIYRAAAQWFVRMDEPDASTAGVFAIDPAAKTLRETALDAIDATAFYPENGRARLHDMIAHRPDWCISRQRNWGVPLPLFLHKTSGELHPDTLALIDRAADIVEQGGVEAWSRLSAADVLGAARASITPRATTSSTSGSIPARPSRMCCAAAIRARPCPTTTARSPRPTSTSRATTSTAAGSTSSLLIACAVEGHAPYRGLLTHGFTVDGSGRKMSKSLGNFIGLRETTEKLGAEIIRLWCAATDYSGDLAIDDKILARVVDAYRRIRNTLRFLLANTSDFDPAVDAVPLASMLRSTAGHWPAPPSCRRDRRQLRCGARRLRGRHYGVYEFHPVVAKVQVFCSEDLGAFYLDILKDRLYTTAAKSAARRSAQTALWHVAHAMLRWMAPFLSFTAEEAWKVFGPKGSASIFTETYSDTRSWSDAALLEKWQRIGQVRAESNRQIEGLRTEGKLGSSLQAEVTVAAGPKLYEALASLGDDLRFVLIASAASLEAMPSTGDAEFQVRAAVSSASKCERCWHYRNDVGVDPAHPTICGRCIANLFGAGEPRHAA
jgi:isoleucyl-tRNA synthetase